jgi:RNA polymerase sigma factor (sigma-70 family)
MWYTTRVGWPPAWASEDVAMTRGEFGQYVGTEYAKLYRFVKSRIANAHDAEDLLQKTLLKLLLICDDIDARAPSGFFFTALRNAIIDYWRKRGHQPPPKELPDQVPGREGAASLEDEAERERCRKLIHHAASGLTPRERQALTAYWKAWGDRGSALEELGLSEAGKDERYRVYDGALFHAKRKLALALQPARGRLEDAGPYRIWELVYEELCGTAPDAAP